MGEPERRSRCQNRCAPNPILTTVTLHVCLRAALLLIGAVTTLAQSSSFTVAIARPDGYLVPFAAYTNGRWERAWPAAGEGNVDKPTFENTPSVWRRHGRPVSKTWHVWPVRGGPSLQTRVTAVESVEAHCVAQVALKTDLQPSKAEHPIKQGVAVDSRQPLVSIEAVAKLDPLWKRAERAVAPTLSQLEAQRAQADRLQLPLETPRPIVQVTALYRESRSTNSPLYFVAEKPYRTARAAENPQCKAVTIMTGWLTHEGAEALTLHSPRVFLTDCDAKEVRTAEPLAAIHLSDRLFWILQEHGYEDESYIVAEIARSGIRYHLAVNGGGC
jgi:hypothetical protein